VSFVVGRLAAWVNEMGGGVNSTAFPSSAIGSCASVRRRCQSRHSFGCLAVGAYVGWSPTGLLDFVRFASESLRPIPGFQPSRNCLCALGLIACRAVRARVASWGFPSCALAGLRVVSFGQRAQARGRAPIGAASMLRRTPIFTASVAKSVPGFMGSRPTRRPTGRRGGTAASTKPCRPGAG
jgi:hypothetical protein